MRFNMIPIMCMYVFTIVSFTAFSEEASASSVSEKFIPNLFGATPVAVAAVETPSEAPEAAVEHVVQPVAQPGTDDVTSDIMTINQRISEIERKLEVSAGFIRKVRHEVISEKFEEIESSPMVAAAISVPGNVVGVVKDGVIVSAKTIAHSGIAAVNAVGNMTGWNRQPQPIDE